MKLFSRKKKIQTNTTSRTVETCWLDNYRTTSLQSRGALEVIGFERIDGISTTAQNIALPTENLKLESVTNYGTMVLKNQSVDQPMIVPAHIGFFQHGAQNHATARTLTFKANETRKVKDCFCIQAAQGGLLGKSEQRFLMLPSGLRGLALSKQNVEGYNRLWDDIDGFTRKFGVARGGHLERFLRPNFRHLLPFRHSFEPTKNQVGAAFFVSNELHGIEICPSPRYFAELFPILAIYCFGPTALLAERRGDFVRNEPVDITDLTGLATLRERLISSRARQTESRLAEVAAIANSKWNSKLGELHGGLRVSTIEQSGWAGQTVHTKDDLLYLSIFKSAQHR